VANYKAWYKLLCPAPVRGCLTSLAKKRRKKKKKPTKTFPRIKPLSFGFFKAPLMESGGGRCVFGNGNSHNNPSIHHSCPPLTAIDRFLYACWINK
jgi:hypothetical protein